MELLVHPSVPVESAPGAALLRVAAVAAGISMLVGMQRQSHFYADLKKNRKITHFLKKTKEITWYWRDKGYSIQCNTLELNHFK